MRIGGQWLFATFLVTLKQTSCVFVPLLLVHAVLIAPRYLRRKIQKPYSHLHGGDGCEVGRQGYKKRRRAIELMSRKSDKKGLGLA